MEYFMEAKVEECFQRAKDVLKENSTKLGVIAGREYYNDIWCRDGLVSCLGMSASDDEELVRISEKTLESIAKFQKPNGQIPNKFSPDGKKLCFGEGGCVDSSLWYPIAVLNHYRNAGKVAFLKRHMAKVEKAVEWAGCLDLNDDLLLETHEGSDWMDLLVRSGRVLYDQVLYYKALTAADEMLGILGKTRKYTVLAKGVRKNINLFFWPKQENLDLIKKQFGYSGIDRDFEAVLQSGDMGYYYADIGFRKYDPRCDVFANVLAVVFDVADHEKAGKILDNVAGASEPYPIKVLQPPISMDFFRPFYFRSTDLPHLQQPGNYHNGGIWPMAGGFYVMALKKAGRDPEHALEKLAAANKASKEQGKEWEFNEWLSANGVPMGSAYQSWSAAMFLLAFEYVKGKSKLWWLSPA